MEIPPLLRALHPKLKVADYRRYVRDPLFTFKSTSVCENCYLVFADVAGAALDAAPGTTLREARKATTWISETARGRRRAKEKKSRRQRVGTAPAKAKLRAKGKRLSASASSLRSGRIIGEAPSTAPAQQIPRRLQSPELPPRIDANNVHDLEIGKSMPLLSASLHAGSSRESSPSEMRASTAAPDAFRRTLQEREDAFFRDLYRNPNMQSGHPLTHMVTSHAKLEMARAQSSPQLDPVHNSRYHEQQFQQQRLAADSQSLLSSPYSMSRASLDSRRSPSRGGARSASPSKMRQTRGAHPAAELNASARHRSFCSTRFKRYARS